MIVCRFQVAKDSCQPQPTGRGGSESREIQGTQGGRRRSQVHDSSDHHPVRPRLLCSVDRGNRLAFRIMKARKTIENQPLIREVVSQLLQRFTPKIPAIKKVCFFLKVCMFSVRSHVHICRRSTRYLKRGILNEWRARGTSLRMLHRSEGGRARKRRSTESYTTCSAPCQYASQ